jgi:hypothetical protein
MQQSIKRTASAYRRWREANPGRTAQAPVDLQRRVVELLEKHSWEEVCEVVGVKRSRLAGWRREHLESLGLTRRRRPRPERVHEQATPIEAPSFLELPIAAVSAQSIEVDLRLPSGVVVHARTTGDAAGLGDFVTRIIGAASVRS